MMYSVQEKMPKIIIEKYFIQAYSICLQYFIKRSGRDVIKFAISQPLLSWKYIIF